MQNVLMGSLGIPDAVLARARRVTHDISRRAADLGGGVSADADEILTGRAALLGLAPAGLISAGGSTRLLATRDGWCALTLSRVDDIETVPALLEMTGQPADPWAALAAAAADRDAAEFVARARLLDLPAAVLGEVAARTTAIRRQRASRGQVTIPGAGRRPVVDVGRTAVRASARRRRSDRRQGRKPEQARRHASG